jgi:uncharacterized protein (DUF433 family)
VLSKFAPRLLMHDASPAPSAFVFLRHREGLATLSLKETFMVFDRVNVDPKSCQGQPTIRGTRITVAVILRMIVSGMTPQEIAQDYPELSEKDVR